MIQVVDIEKSYSAQLLFKGITFNMSKGEKIGLVGRNGSGKSTLFKILLNEESVDSGLVSIPKNYRIGTLKQHLEFSEDTILKECMKVMEGEAKFDNYKAEKMLLGLGFSMSDMDRAPREFSGGYQIRLNLAKVLLTEPDCLLLDEPTNYLDIVSMRWLSKFLREFRGELILITHDRGFMDSVTTHTMGIWRQKLVKIKGSSDKYFEQILLEEEIYEKTRVNSEKRRQELEDFVARFKAKASKAAQAQSRLKLLEKMPEMEALAMVNSLDFEFNYKECPGKILLEMKDVSFGYTDELLIKNFSFTLLRNDKVAIIGKNGKGKSTLLNLLAGEIFPNSGSIQKNVNLLIGHFGQTNINRLNLDNTIEEEVASADPQLPIQKIRSLCGTMMFSGDLAKKKIKVLSGGERARVLLAKLLAKPANLLLLDEPTNHLDQDSVESLTMELQNYPGAVIIVTHSESMIRALAQKLIVFHHDKVEFLADNYDGFLQKIGWGDEALSQKEAKESTKLTRNEAKKIRSEIIMERSKMLSPLKREIENLEKEILKLEDEQAKIEKKMIDQVSSMSSLEIQEASTRLAQIKNKVENDFEKLTEITLKHDDLYNEFENKLSSLEN